MYGYVYKTTNLLNGKIYVGQKNSSEFDPHYYGSGIFLNKAIEKYGKENFQIEILYWAKDKDELNLKEIEYIDYYKSLYECYNIAIGGMGGDTTSQHPDKIEIIEKRKQGLVKWHASLSDEEKKHWIDSIKKAKTGKSNGREGYIHNSESIAKIKESNRISAKNRDSSWKNNHAKAMEKRKGHIPGNSKKIEVNGIIYPTKRHVYEALKIYKIKLDKMIESGEAKYV